VISPGLVRLHRCVALGLGPLVVAMGLTGAALVFREELTAVFTPAVKVSEASVEPGEYARVVAAVERVDPGARSMDIVPAQRPGRATQVVIHGAGREHYLYVDPHDGRVVADGERQWLPFATLFELHRRFMLGIPGEYAVGIAGFALAFMGLTGLFLWWPRKLKQAFRVRWDGNRLAVSYDLHRCAGAAFALLLILNAVIGITMTFDEASVALVNRVSGSPPAPLPAASSNAVDAVRPFDEIVAAADRALPGGRVVRIMVRDGNAPVVVRKRMPADNDTHGSNRIYVDAASATVVGKSPLAAQPPGNAMFEWSYPLHTGTLVGVPYRVLLVLAGCVPLLSLVTGLIVWRSRAARRGPAKGGAALRQRTAQTASK
jgi:uncharacterized iron-regulated membrane protein